MPIKQTVSLESNMSPFEAIAYRYVEALKVTGQYRKSYWYTVVFGGRLNETPTGHVPCHSKREAQDAASEHSRAIVIAGNAII